VSVGVNKTGQNISAKIKRILRFLKKQNKTNTHALTHTRTGTDERNSYFVQQKICGNEEITSPAQKGNPWRTQTPKKETLQ